MMRYGTFILVVDMLAPRSHYMSKEINMKSEWLHGRIPPMNSTSRTPYDLVNSATAFMTFCANMRLGAPPIKTARREVSIISAGVAPNSIASLTCSDTHHSHLVAIDK